jgi:hypothetical protein
MFMKHSSPHQRCAPVHQHVRETIQLRDHARLGNRGDPQKRGGWEKTSAGFHF